jgi:hypothetical protein
MRKSIWLIILLPLLATSQEVERQQLYSNENDFAIGTTAGTFLPTGTSAGADTLQFILWFGSTELHYSVDNVRLEIEIDTTAHLVAGSRVSGYDSLAVTAYPITFSPTNALVTDALGAAYRKYNINRRAFNLYGEVLWKYGITMTEMITGTAASDPFSMSPDTTYAFHHDTWWSDTDVIGILFYLVSTSADSLTVVDVTGIYRLGK